MEMKNQLNNSINENYEIFLYDIKTNKGLNTNPSNKKLFERYDILKLNIDEIAKYKFLLVDEYKFNSFFNFIKMFKKYENLNEMLNNKQKINMSVKILYDNINKILLLRKFETNNKISPFDINFINSKPEINITTEYYKLISKCFRITKSKPDNIIDLKTFY